MNKKETTKPSTEKKTKGNSFVHAKTNRETLKAFRQDKQMKEKAMNAEPLGGTLKFKIDNKTVYIDGSGDTNIISTDDKEADCTISASLDVLMKLKNGEINPMMAVMGGQVKIGGDMGLATKIQ